MLASASMEEMKMGPVVGGAGCPVSSRGASPSCFRWQDPYGFPAVLSSSLESQLKSEVTH